MLDTSKQQTISKRVYRQRVEAEVEPGLKLHSSRKIIEIKKMGRMMQL